MGFGLATLGYGFMLTYNAGGGIFAGILLAYGFFLASRLNKHFMKASVSALFLIPHSVLLLLFTFRVLNEKDILLLSSISRTVFYCAWLITSYYYLMAVRDIAIENSAIKLKNKAKNRLSFTTIFLFVAVLMSIFNDFVPSAMLSIWIIMQYIVVIVNTLFLHSCFILITTEALDKKERQYFADEEKKQRENRTQAI